MANKLFEYMKKLQNTADYLLRGFILEDPKSNTAIEILNDELTQQRNAFAICEYGLYDELEMSYYGEQKSIGVLIECIEDGAYENQIKKTIDFSKPYVPSEDDAEFYNNILKRVKWMIRSMTMSLICGTHIPLDEDTVSGLEMTYLEHDEIELQNDDEEEDNEKEIITHYLMYDDKTDSFNALSLNGEIYIDNIDIDVAMSIYNGFLYDQEQEEIRKKAMQEYKKNSRKKLNRGSYADSEQEKNKNRKEGEER